MCYYSLCTTQWYKKQKKTKEYTTMAHATTDMTSDQALQALMDGNKRYVAGTLTHPHQDLQRISEVSSGQTPFAIILSCADSRVVPEVMFDQGVGDIFVIRVAGNVATDDTIIASMEYAVAMLGAPLLMVLGHQSCGAVGAAVQGGDLPGHLNSLVQAITPAVEQAKSQPGDTVDNAINANVRLMVEKLQTMEPIFADKVRSGALKVVGARYSLANGAVELV
jgi:carbonic anhydrase